jgi:amino acid adenylation domain-containing protein
MNRSIDSRAFWHEVLTAGGVTAVPRWTLRPEPGVATYETELPADLVTDLDRVAAGVGVSRGSVLLAAHAKVLATLSDEIDVTTGFVTVPGGDPLPCRLSTRGRDWRDLLEVAHRAVSALVPHTDIAVDALRRELGQPQPSQQAEIDRRGDAAGPSKGGAFRIGLIEATDGLRLWLRYRTDALDADAAARIAGYHRTALTQLAADPDADHRHPGLVSAAERRLQVDGFAGPRRELPDRRLHELFEQQVRTHPETIVAGCGDRSWTYRELNSRANRIGRALLDRGLRREGVVAVVTERNLDWLASVLAVFKAGGTYLPVEPHFPPDRVATMLSRAGCRRVVIEAATPLLDAALESLPEVEVLRIDTAYEDVDDDRDLGVQVDVDQLAYIYFTSGSTGEPKGAMCEHGGLLNHVYAKIDDLEIGPGQVVAQTAPQCFDISLWQLVSALVVGGRTLIVEQDAILDVERFVDTITAGRVTVLQVVPSYLDVVLDHLQRQPRELPDLRFVSVTGEALPWELTRRWFEAQPGIRLVNAYGLTETSDDTNHEVLDRPPEQASVPVGRPVGNVRVYVVDDHLRLVPLGAPGEIVFSGVCVGRGYVNDPERTRLAFVPDPLRPGQRCYRSGDRGRWRPDRKLEFLGRRDAQVKIAGFRIEIGEIENALAQLLGVGQCAVVVTSEGRRSRLIAFYSGRELDSELLAEGLGRTLPGYMVPSAFHWRPELPVTANGKVDRSTLTELGAVLGEAGGRPRPSTPSERQVASAWAEVLNLPPDQIGRHDHFYDRGGTSLAALQLVLKLGRTICLEDIKSRPVLADLARLVDVDDGRSSVVAVSNNGGSEGKEPTCPSHQQPR